MGLYRHYVAPLRLLILNLLPISNIPYIDYGLIFRDIIVKEYLKALLIHGIDIEELPATATEAGQPPVMIVVSQSQMGRAQHLTIDLARV